MIAKSSVYGQAAIGKRDWSYSSGNITIHGVHIDANADATFNAIDIPGIGGGSCNITIYGGTFRAYGNKAGGISAGPGGTENIYGGAVTAIDISSGAGIGGQNNKSCGTITITGVT